MLSGENVGVRLQAFARAQAQPTAQKLFVAMLGQPEEPTGNATGHAGHTVGNEFCGS